jgi:hypothetical protein
MYANNAGQSLLNEVADATGGKNLWQGIGAAVSFKPFFEELSRRLGNQYELVFSVRLDGKLAVESLKLKIEGLAAEVVVPQKVFVERAGATE